MARILVVGDSPDVRLALATILEDAGYDVVEAENGDQVFDLAVKESPNLVLLDVMMPRVNGFDALATLKADTRTSPIPVIMVTAKAEETDRISGLEIWRWLALLAQSNTSRSHGLTATLNLESIGHLLPITNRRVAKPDVALVFRLPV